jgi:signal transduction histidine kinase
MTLVSALNRAAIRVQLPMVLVAVPILAALHGWWIAPIIVDSILAEQPVATVDAAIVAARVVVFVVGLVVTIACAAAAMLLRGSIRHAVEQLQAATEAVARGDLQHRIRSTRSDELGRLAGAIDVMAERLERLEQSRRRTLACVSHELRTPLTIIQGHAYTLARTEQDPARADRLGLVQQEAMRLARLVDDLVHASSLHAGSARLAIERCDLAAIVERQAGRFAEEARERDVTISLSTSRGRILADADPVRFEQVMSNLLSNAVRHAVRGSVVELRVSAARGADTPHSIVVTNRCRPLDPSIAEQVFEPFVQGDARSGSVGLGLTIVHALVAAHGGSIGLDVDAASSGTARFTILLPAPRRPSAIGVLRRPRRGHGIRPIVTVKP